MHLQLLILTHIYDRQFHSMYSSCSIYMYTQIVAGVGLFVIWLVIHRPIFKMPYLFPILVWNKTVQLKLVTGKGSIRIFTDWSWLMWYIHKLCIICHLCLIYPCFVCIWHWGCFSPCCELFNVWFAYWYTSAMPKGFRAEK